MADFEEKFIPAFVSYTMTMQSNAMVKVDALVELIVVKELDASSRKPSALVRAVNNLMCAYLQNQSKLNDLNDRIKKSSLEIKKINDSFWIQPRNYKECDA